MIYGSIIKIVDESVFINALDVCFKVPKRNFLQSDLLSEECKYLFYVMRDKFSNEVFLTRVSNDFFITLLKLYIPEIKDGIIKIVKVFRCFNSRIYVFFKSEIENAVSYFLGANSDKLQHMMKELSSEKLNFIDVDRSFYKAINLLFKIDKFFSNVIIDLKDGKCNIYSDYHVTHRFLQRNIKYRYIVKEVFDVDLELVFVSTEEDYVKMIQSCFGIELISEIKTNDFCFF